MIDDIHDTGENMLLNRIKYIALCSTVAVASSLAYSTQALAREQVQVVGSSTVYPFSAIVAERFGNRGKFKTPVIESTGTGGGMKLFCGGIGSKYPDISNASRAMKSSEWDNCQKNGVKEIIEVAFGNDGIAFANHINGPGLNLTRKQLWMALAEHGPKPEKWNEIEKLLSWSRHLRPEHVMPGIHWS
jgi:phosphate transport system substrate-binding protein